MNNQTTNDTPETDGEWNRLACLDHHEFERQLADFARKLERERDAAKFDADDESRWAMSYKTQRDELRTALSACMEDSIELLGERGWWKDESRCGYAQRYEQTAENIRTAQCLLNGGQA